MEEKFQLMKTGKVNGEDLLKLAEVNKTDGNEGVLANSRLLNSQQVNSRLLRSQQTKNRKVGSLLDNPSQIDNNLSQIDNNLS